jgi:hypothetical protein
VLHKVVPCLITLFKGFTNGRTIHGQIGIEKEVQLYNLSLSLSGHFYPEELHWFLD